MNRQDVSEKTLWMRRSFIVRRRKPAWFFGTKNQAAFTA
jgi:hypothetical protein